MPGAGGAMCRRHHLLMWIQMQYEPSKLTGHRQENPGLPRDVKASLLIATCHSVALRYTKPIQSFVYPQISYT
jgi:hypothetical protein